MSSSDNNWDNVEEVFVFHIVAGYHFSAVSYLFWIFLDLKITNKRELEIFLS
jgi:hypothetical protein